MLQTLEDWSYNIQEKIFRNQFKEVQADVISGSTLLADIASILSDKNLKVYNDIILEILLSVQKSDLLLLADLLEFKLKPFLQKLK